jgi:hypothetical protein
VYSALGESAGCSVGRAVTPVRRADVFLAKLLIGVPGGLRHRAPGVRNQVLFARPGPGKRATGKRLGTPASPRDSRVDGYRNCAL